MKTAEEKLLAETEYKEDELIEFLMEANEVHVNPNDMEDRIEDIKCPYCCELLSEEELEDVSDIGCPSCRRIFDLEDYID